MMKALMYEGIERLEMQETERPEGNFIIRVTGCGICGTDLKTYLKGHPFFTPPTILGHEYVGEIVSVPKGSTFSPGEKVVVAPYIECGNCGVCKRDLGQLCQDKSYVSGGGFCEYLSIPDNYEHIGGVFRLPDGADQLVFTLVEPLACVLNGTSHLKINAYSRVLVVGSGPMGALFALYFQQQGVPVAVVEPNDERRTVVEGWGITCYRPGEAPVSEYDTVVIAVNKAELVAEYVEGVADGGTVLVFSGLPKSEKLVLDSYAVHYREITVTGSYGYAVNHFAQAFEMIKENPNHYRRLITHTFPLEQGTEAFQLLRNGKAFKIVLEP